MEREPIDIVLITHNHLELTITCIKALYEHTNIPFRLIIVDDSTDLTPQYCRQLAKEKGNIVYTRQRKPLLNSNRKFNIGIKKVTSDYFVVIGNSMTVEPYWLEGALELMEKDSSVGCVGMKLLYPSGIIECAGMTFDQDGNLFDYGRGESGHRHGFIRELVVTNGPYLLRKEAIIKAPLDTKTYIAWSGFEDMDMCMTIREAGYRVMYCGTSCAYHLARATTGENPDFAKNWEENRQRFCKKWLKGAKKYV